MELTRRYVKCVDNIDVFSVPLLYSFYDVLGVMKFLFSMLLFMHRDTTNEIIDTPVIKFLRIEEKFRDIIYKLVFTFIRHSPHYELKRVL